MVVIWLKIKCEKKKGFNIIWCFSFCINGFFIILFFIKMDFKYIFICDEFFMYLDKI